MRSCPSPVGTRCFCSVSWSQKVISPEVLRTTSSPSGSRTSVRNLTTTCSTFSYGTVCFRRSRLHSRIRFRLVSEFLQHSCHFTYVVIRLEVDQLRISQSVLDIAMSKQLHCEQDVFCSVVSHCCEKVSECVEMDLQ
jgi:hypothetical protein